MDNAEVLTNAGGESVTLDRDSFEIEHFDRPSSINWKFSNLLPEFVIQRVRHVERP
jgi:hypothetical protein